MKIVVFGPDKRTGALRDGTGRRPVLRLRQICRTRRQGEPHPIGARRGAGAVGSRAPDRGGPRALDNADEGARLSVRRGAAPARPARRPPWSTRPTDITLHAPRPNGARIACAGGNFADHAAAMAEKMLRQALYRRRRARRSAMPASGASGRCTARWLGPDGEVIYPARGQPPRLRGRAGDRARQARQRHPTPRTSRIMSGA